MSESKVYPVKAHIGKNALLDKAGYEAMYQASVQDPDGFWGEQGKILDWMKPYTRVKNTSYDPGHVSIKWYEDGLLNVSANCLDRHLAQRGDKVAIIWEGDNPAEDRKLTYRELHTEVCKFANVLKAQGV
ncbi:MAG: acetyl-coenzyme A synthetase N-terminal domain-containing protein, partial [Aeromonas sp.]